MFQIGSLKSKIAELESKCDGNGLSGELHWLDICSSHSTFSLFSIEGDYV